MNEREAKLPMWARDELDALRRRADRLKSRLDLEAGLYAPNGKSYVEMDYNSLRTTPRDLRPPHTYVRFWLNENGGGFRESYVDVHIEENSDGHPCLRLRANDSIAVVPSCANVVEMYALAHYGRVDTGTQEEDDGS